MSDGQDRSGAQDAGAQQTPGDPGQGDGQQKDAASSTGLTAEAVNDIVTKAITSQLRRFESKVDQRFSSLTPQEPAPPQQQPQPGSKGPKPASEVEALTARLKAVEQEREAERKQALQQRNDLTLREAVQATKTHRPEEMFRYLKADPSLRTGEDGSYFAVDQHGGHLDLQSWALSQYETNATWRPAAGRDGLGPPGGATQAGGGGGATGSKFTQDEWNAKLGTLYAEGKEQEAQAWMQKVLDGLVTIEIPDEG